MHAPSFLFGKDYMMMASGSRRCPYAVLGVDASASRDDIARSYRRQALLLHPDKNKSAEEAAFHELREAFDVLSDPEKKTEFDTEMMLERLRFCRPSSSSLPRDRGRGGGDSGRHPPDVSVDLRTACVGGPVTVVLAKPVSIECPECAGKGVRSRSTAALLSFSEPCATCAGRGSIVAEGEDALSEFEVFLPVGVREGTELVATSSEGDQLVVRVRYSKTGRDDDLANAVVDGKSGDVEVVRTIGVAEALGGGFRLTDVVDLSGRVRDAIDVPLGSYTPPDSRIRIARGGLPPDGDLVIRVAVAWPSGEEAASRRFRKRIRIHATILRHILHGGTKKNI